MELKLLRAPGGFEAKSFLAVFRQSSLENAPEWYPDLDQKAALATHEAGFRAYRKVLFWQE